MVGERQYVLADVRDTQFVDQPHRLRQSDRSGIVGCAARLPAARAFDKFVVAHRSGGRRLKVLAPSAFGFGDGKIAGNRRLHLRAKFFAEVKKAATEGRHQPLVPAAGDRVHRSFPHVERNRADLLDCVDNEKDAALAAKSRQRFEIAPKAIAPLHGANRDHPRALADRGLDVLDQDLSIAIAGRCQFRCQVPRASASTAPRLRGTPDRK